MEEDIQQLIDEALQEAGQNSDIYSNQLTTTDGYTAIGWLNGFTAGMSLWWNWAIIIAIVASQWMIFVKANRPGWAAIIPIYNTLVFLQVINRPWWWILLLLVPLVNIVIGIMMNHQLSLAFGKSAWFTVGLIFLPFIMYPILGFGGDKYSRPA